MKVKQVMVRFSEEEYAEVRERAEAEERPVAVVVKRGALESLRAH